MKGYEKKVVYQFEVADEEWKVLAFDRGTIEFEETRKNGQEDTHIYGVAYHSEDGWKLDEDTREVLSLYRNDETAPAIEAFFDKYGTPWKSRPSRKSELSASGGATLRVGPRLPNEPDFVPNDEGDV